MIKSKKLKINNKQGDVLKMLPITRKISDYNHSAPNNIKYIVIHDTGNYSDSASGNANYFNGGNRGASAHYFVDPNSIYQVVEDYEGSWNCGDGNMQYGIGNHNGIGIEMCKSNGDIPEQTVQNTLELVKYLMNKYGIDIDHVVRHYDASRKTCPATFSANGWARWYEFKAKLSGQSYTLPTPKPQGNPNDVYEVPSCNPSHLVVNDDFFVRDSQGYRIYGRIVSEGDKIQVISSKNDLLEVIYPSSSSKTGFVRGFIRNIPTLIKPISQMSPQPIPQSTTSKDYNAIVKLDWLYTRLSDGSIEQGHRVDIGDKIKVIDISYSRQLAKISYPTPNGFRDAYVTNNNCIEYINKPVFISEYKDVFDRFDGSKIGSVGQENVIILEDLGDKLNVVYCTDKGQWTKSGVIYK